MFLKRNGDCSFPLLVPSRAGHAHCLLVLLEKHHGAVNERDNSGKPPLVIAAEYGHNNCLVVTLRFLIDRGAAINATNRACQTALIRATEVGYSNCVSVLIEKGADVFIVDKEGKTALDVATQSDHVDCTARLRIATIWSNIFRSCCGFGGTESASASVESSGIEADNETQNSIVKRS